MSEFVTLLTGVRTGYDRLNGKNGDRSKGCVKGFTARGLSGHPDNW